MTKCDVLIAGAGPAGSMAALTLARAGRKVIVLEKDHFPRAKVCGYSINPRCWSVWERHGLTPGFDQLPQFKIGGFTLEREGIPVLRHRFRDDRARTVDRTALDAWLAHEARASGVEYRFGVTLQSLTSHGAQSSEGEIHAPVIIGADGRNSIVGRLSGLDRRSVICQRVGWHADIEASALDDHVHMNVFPEGYYGINRIDATRINIAMVLFGGGEQAARAILGRYFPGAACIPGRTIHPISRRPWKVSNGRSWLVGDAARVLEPLTGEGIYSALATAEMAAHNILAIDRIGVRAAIARYARQHRQFYGLRSLVNSAVRWSLEDSPRSMRIMTALGSWPTAAARLVELVQRPETHRLQAEISS